MYGMCALPIRLFRDDNEIRMNRAVMEKSWPSPKSRYAHSGGRPRPIVMVLDSGWLKLTVDGRLYYIILLYS